MNYLEKLDLILNEALEDSQELLDWLYELPAVSIDVDNFQLGSGAIVKEIVAKSEPKPVEQINQVQVPPPATQADQNYMGTQSDVNSEPNMAGINSWNTVKAIPQWQYDVEDSQSKIDEALEPDLWQYVYQGHEQDDICAGFHNKIFDKF